MEVQSANFMVSAVSQSAAFALSKNLSRCIDTDQQLMP